jgi:hypothetical protein
MIATLKTLDKDQREAVLDLIVLSCAATFIMAWVMFVHVNKPKATPTWSQTIANMPPAVRQDIAIDWCASNRKVCMSVKKSPMIPMDGDRK